MRKPSEEIKRSPERRGKNWDKEENVCIENFSGLIISKQTCDIEVRDHGEESG